MSEEIYQMIERDQDNASEIAQWLDALVDGEHYAALSQLTRSQQRQLFAKCEANHPLTLDYFVNSNHASLSEVIHRGRNTLPLYGQGKIFEKRMCRTQQHADLLYGYNHTSYMGWFGPGYFVARETPEHLDWQQRGAVVIDYFMRPQGEVPSHWPSYRPNWMPPQALFYYHTRDFMRRVSEHVSIGVAYRNEQCLEHYFILCKESA